MREVMDLTAVLKVNGDRSVAVLTVVWTDMSSVNIWFNKDGLMKLLAGDIVNLTGDVRWS